MTEPADPHPEPGQDAVAFRSRPPADTPATGAAGAPGGVPSSSNGAGGAPGGPARAPGGVSGLRVPPGPLTAVAGLVLVLLAAILLREIASLIVPVIFGLFLALLTYPLIPALQRRGLKHGGALAIALVSVLVVVLATFGMIALSVGELVIEIPKYQDRVSAEIATITAFLAGFGITVDLEAILSVISPEQIAGFVRPVASAVSGGGVAILVLVLTMVYALAGGSSMGDRAMIAFGERHGLLTGVAQFGIDLRHYIVVRAKLGLFAAVAIFIVLVVLSVPLPLLWAFLVFLASFIPNVGSLIAMVPTLVLAFLDGGLVTAAIVLVAYLVINMIQDQFLQPIIMGSELNLSPLVVFIAVVVWAWILGAAGALLAVPLTVGLLALMEAYPASRPYAALLRNKVEPVPGTEPPAVGGPFTAPLDTR
jgi:predicted PurR-regulated permease PerM